MNRDFLKRLMGANTIFAAGFIFLMVMPVVQMKFGIFPKRLLPKEPRVIFTIDSIKLSDLPAKCEGYLEGNFGFRYALIRYDNIIRVKYLKMITPMHDVIVGRGGYLYYNISNVNAVTANNFVRLTEYRDEDLIAIRDRIEEHNKLLTARGIRYFVFVPPNKETIYPEYLPPGIKMIEGKTRLDALLERLRSVPDLNIIDVRANLMQAKSKYPVYFRGDSHWNDYGAFIACLEITKRLSRFYPQMPKLSPEDFDINVTKAEFEKDLAAMLVMNDIFEDTDVHFRLKPGTAQEKVRASRKIRKLVMFGDCFTDRMVAFMKNYFEDVVVINTGFDERQIETEKPDVVIEERLERHMDRL